MPVTRGWTPLVVLATSVAVGFGAMFYAYSVLITERAAGGRFSTTALSTGYGGFILISGGLAFVVGRLADRRGVRPLVLAGALFGGGGLFAFSVAAEAWHVVAASWFLLGPAGALLFYEPAFIAIEQWFGSTGRARALAVLTLIGGLAGPIFLPLTGYLVDQVEWRPTARVLAVLVFAAGAAAAAVLPAHSRGAGAPREGVRLRDMIGQPRFLLFTLSVVLVFGSMQAVFFHRIAVFEASGFSLGLVATWAGIASLLSLPGRFVIPLVGERLGGLRVHLAVSAVLAVSVWLMIEAEDTWVMVAHFVIFGLGFGGLVPLRAIIMGRWYSGPRYGSIMGVQWSLAAVTGAAGPWLVGLARDTTGGYAGPFWAVAGALVVAVAMTLLAMRATRLHS